MKTISISNILKKNCPKIRIGCIQCKVNVNIENNALWQLIQQTIEKKKMYLTEEISKIQPIADAKKAYRKLGQDPSRYRLSAEALLRRISKGKGLYKINNVVDVLNTVSIKSGFSIGGYDADKIQGNIQMGTGVKKEPYEAIGKGKFNIHNLPVFRDEKGAFGSPTSDAVRTMVTGQTTSFLMLIIDFGRNDSLEKTMESAVYLLEKYAGAKEVEKRTV